MKPALRHIGIGLVWASCSLGWAVCAGATPAHDAPRTPAPAVDCRKIGSLIEKDRLDAALDPLTKLILRGDEACFASLVQYAQHSTDETLLLRLLIGTHRRLLTGLDTYRGEERAHAERFLSGAPFKAHPPPFSRRATEKQLAEWEAALAAASRQR